MKKTVIKMLRTCAETNPGTNYSCEKKGKDWDSMTYADALQESRYISSGLLEIGIKKGDKISTLAEGRNRWITSEFGMLFLGATNVPLALKLIPDEVIFRITHSESTAIIASLVTIKKLAQVYKNLENKIKIIYLEDNLNGLEELCEESGIKPGENLIFYRELLDLGKSGFEKNEAKLDEIEASIEEDDIVTISYTSGTTGDPKGIMLSHFNYFHNCKDAMEYFNVSTGDRLYICIPVDHSFAHTVGLYAALLRGLSLYFVDFGGGGVQYAKNVAKNLVEANPHFMLSVPALTSNFMNKIKDGVAAKGKFINGLFNAGINAGIRMNGDGFRKANFLVKMVNWIPFKLADLLVFSKIRKIFGNNMRYIVGGGALLDIRQQRFFYALGVPVYQGYGLSEATPIISANTQEIHKMGSSGRVITNVDCKIIKNDGSEAATGEQGQILIKGNNVMMGYYKNPVTTAATVIDNWLYTGDLGYIDRDKFLIVIGREKALLISADGEKYSPEGIEEAIQNSSSLIFQVMIYNDMRKFTSSVITLRHDRIKALIKRDGLKKPEQVIDAISKDLYAFKDTPEFKDQFPEKWIPTTFQIVDEAFSDDNQMINSALKMVRHTIQKTYQSLIDNMYLPGGNNMHNPHNIKVIESIMK